jgi:hypothetical protein
VNSKIFYKRSDLPFCKTWETWAARWCRWVFSIPRKGNPCLDKSGKFSSASQNDEFVWFLCGTLGNIDTVKRRCTIPSVKAIFFPVIVKEDSFAENLEVHSHEELRRRVKGTIDGVRYFEAFVDNMKVDPSEIHRVQSEIFDLVFPKENIYDIVDGVTHSICDGYWLFLKPLEVGRHHIHFKAMLEEPNLKFSVDVLYEIETSYPTTGQIAQ